MAIDTEIRLYEARGKFIIAALREPKSTNLALEEMISNQILLWPRILVLPLVAFFRRMPIFIADWIGYKNWGEYREFSRYDILGNQGRILHLTRSQESLEAEVLKKFDLEKKKYFCIAIRDGEFYAGRTGQENESYRNLDFSLFMPLIEGMRKYPFKFVRMGRGSSKNFNSSNLIDYASKEFTSDLADLVLLKNSLGLINTGDGIAAVATILDVPILYLNHAPWEILCTFSRKNWIAPSIFIDPKTKSIVNLDRILSNDSLCLSSSKFLERGLIIRPPDHKEIIAYGGEFIIYNYIKEIEGELSKKHLDLNKEFWDMYSKKLPNYARNFHKNIKSIVPLEYLENYLEALRGT